jgi:predicted DNA-binding protein
MAKPVVQVTLRLAPETAKQLEMLAREKEQSLSGLIAEILEAYLSRLERRPRGS